MFGLGLALAAAGPATAVGPPGEPQRADLPVPTYTAPAAPAHRGPLLRRRADLMELAGQGKGDLALVPGRPDFVLAPMLWRMPLPWHTAAGREQALQLLAWAQGDNDQYMQALVLHAGESWCTPPLQWAPGARLRLEAAGVEANGSGRLAIQSSGAPAPLYDAVPPLFGPLQASTQLDLALPGAAGTVCFRATGGAVAVGEARVLEPEPEGSDPRPRWIVFTIMDAMRGDVLEGAQAARDLPELQRLAAQGQDYRQALSGGCHTRAGAWPLLTGRDMMRIDPNLAPRVPRHAPLPLVYSRANLFITHWAQGAGYHPVFLGNNAYFRGFPAFARFSSDGSRTTGTVDAAARMPALFARYADERLFLVHWISAPHSNALAPARLYDAFGCGALDAVGRTRCAYEARLRHSDEALGVLEAGLALSGLASRTLQAVTADHGEVMDDGVAETALVGGRLVPLDRGHGFSCHLNEVRVPLVLAGPGISRRTWTAPVSSLDLVPTLLQAMNVPVASRLDGRPLPLAGGPPPEAARPFASYGYCSFSLIEGDRQLIRWSDDCHDRRAPEGALPAAGVELWSHGRRQADNAGTTRALGEGLAAQRAWVGSRLPADAVLFDAGRLGRAEVEVTALEGRIVDYGPSASVYGLSALGAARLEGERVLRVAFEDYQGLYYVTTSPPRAPVQIRVLGAPGRVTTFVGPLQLPLEAEGRPLDPTRYAAHLVSAEAPPRRDMPPPALSLWWQPYRQGEGHAAAAALGDFSRVLREWGYIR